MEILKIIFRKPCQALSEKAMRRMEESGVTQTQVDFLAYDKSFDDLAADLFSPDAQTRKSALTRFENLPETKKAVFAHFFAGAAGELMNED